MCSPLTPIRCGGTGAGAGALPVRVGVGAGDGIPRGIIAAGIPIPRTGTAATGAAGMQAIGAGGIIITILITVGAAGIEDTQTIVRQSIAGIPLRVATMWQVLLIQEHGKLPVRAVLL